MSAIELRPPTPVDGPQITALIRACPPLDANSAYCHLLQSLHFSGTSVVAVHDGLMLGWVSAYRPPSHPEQVFVWQVAVHPGARGSGLGRRMLEELAQRPAADGAELLTATITEANRASWALFEGFAHHRGVIAASRPLFEQATHFAGRHDTEWLVSIPLATAHPNQTGKESL